MISYRHLITLVLLLAIVVVPAMAGLTIKEGVNVGAKTIVDISDTKISFTDKSTGVTASSEMLINNVKFSPAKEAPGEYVLYEEKGTSVFYRFGDTCDGCLKETIALQEDVDIKFRITIPAGYYLKPMPDGSIFVENDIAPTWQSKIAIQKPYGTDAKGKHIPMSYSISGDELSLLYERTGITYPLAIDPTWYLIGGHYETTDGDYKIIKWNTTGTFAWTLPGGVYEVEYLVVGGGGSGASDGAGAWGAGAGGAGGFITGAGLAVSGTETIVVGAGGAAVAANNHGLDGGISSLTNDGATITATGGGGGGEHGTGTGGRAGGSGGGGGYDSGAGGAGIAGQGHDGGVASTGGVFEGGGGGGATEDGNADALYEGGDGLSSALTGETIWYAGGGGGGVGSVAVPHPGGTGGGGAGGTDSAAGVSGTASTGGGGGGGGSGGAGFYIGGSGGSGVVIVKFLTSTLIEYENPTSTIEFIPPNKTIGNMSTSRYQNMTVYVQNLTLVDTIWVNITHPRLWINATNWFTNLTDFSDSAVTVNNIFYNNTTEGTGTNNGFTLVNLSKLNFNTTGTKSYSLGNIQYYLENVSCTNITLPLSYSVSINPPVTTGFNVTVNYTGTRNFSFTSNGALTYVPQYLLNLTYKNAETLSILTDAEVTASWTHSGGTGSLYSGSNTTHTGLMDLFTPAGMVTVVSTAIGYQSSTNIITTPNPAGTTIYLVPEVPTTKAMFYNSHSVRIRILDYYENPLPGTNVTAYYVATTLPSTNISWLVSAFAVDPTVAIEMTDSGLAMAGQTDSNGGLNFVMFEAIAYNLQIVNTTNGVNVNRILYPLDTEYKIRVPLASQMPVNNTLQQMSKTSLPVYQLNASCYNLSLIYEDLSGLTTGLWFKVWARNGTYFLEKDEGNPGTSMIADNFTICYQPMGTEILWGYGAQRLGT
jgi:hypothetical protein